MMTTTETSLSGIHHVTAITADAQKNIDFYCGVLGLRLIKLTVNFDDPGSYHLYYGDALGQPGTVLTFFVWNGAQRGRIGPPQVTTTAFAVPLDATDYWAARLKISGIQTHALGDRFGEPVLGFEDPDGMSLELIGSATGRAEPWSLGSVPIDYAIRGFHSISMAELAYEDTAELLTEVMGFHAIGNERSRFRYRAGWGDGSAATIDLLSTPEASAGDLGAGVVHHVAFRTRDDAEQLAWHREIVQQGFNISPVMDRVYFHSIYYREPGGVLFEIATDGPGFTADEAPDRLGTKLMLPPWLESRREEITRALPPVRLANVTR